MADLTKFRELARNWEALGDTDPMFGVLSDPTKHGGKWDADEFFASGVAHVQKLLRTLTDARATFEPGTCLDFGCGVGRLTIPLSRSFRHTTGVDVARPMIDAARRHLPADARCEFALNRDPHLGRFATAHFDVVHSCLVLQHIPSDVSPGYIAEFFRVTKPGGLVVFQVPAQVFSEAELTAAHALPDAAFAADLRFIDPPASLETGGFATVVVRVTNRGSVTWPHDIPAGRHICLGNHWLRADGSRAVDDDARAFLPHAVHPGDSVDIPLRVQAPEASEHYLLEADLVQEHVSWFAQKGSPTARVEVNVTGAPTRAGDSELAAALPVGSGAQPAVAAAAPAPSLLRRVLRKIRGGTPTFEMHVVPRAVVEQTIQRSGGELIRAVDDNAAGPGWLSYTYICRRR